jgi:hypothetical protein
VLVAHLFLGFLAGGDVAEDEHRARAAVEPRAVAEATELGPRGPAVLALYAHVERALVHGEIEHAPLQAPAIRRRYEVEQTTADEACVADAGREHLPPDWGSNDLSSALERRRPAGATEEVFDLLLALVSNTAQDKPWWLSARFQGSCNYGLLAPESVRALCEGARGISDERSPIAEIVAFLHELSAVGPRWLACTEW